MDVFSILSYFAILNFILQFTNLVLLWFISITSESDVQIIFCFWCTLVMIMMFFICDFDKIQKKGCGFRQTELYLFYKSFSTNRNSRTSERLYYLIFINISKSLMGQCCLNIPLQILIQSAQFNDNSSSKLFQCSFSLAIISFIMCCIFRCSVTSSIKFKNPEDYEEIPDIKDQDLMCILVENNLIEHNRLYLDDIVKTLITCSQTHTKNMSEYVFYQKFQKECKSISSKNSTYEFNSFMPQIGQYIGKSIVNQTLDLNTRHLCRILFYYESKGTVDIFQHGDWLKRRTAKQYLEAIFFNHLQNIIGDFIYEEPTVL